jgi:signal transduction histidine kinase
VQVEGTARDLVPLLRDEVFRIGGEAVRNAFWHAGAMQIDVAIHYGDDEFRLKVQDDGNGIDPKILAEGGRPGHFGLGGLEERAQLLGGKLTIWSEVTRGTRVDFFVPASLAYAKSPMHLRRTAP